MISLVFSNFAILVGCIVSPHSCFNFYFPDDKGWGASLHMLICHLCYLLWRAVRSLAYYLVRLIVFLLLNFKSSLYISVNSLFKCTFENIFFHSLNIVFPRAEVFSFKEGQYNNSFMDYTFSVYLNSLHQLHVHLGFILYYMLGILQFCLLHLGL